tara:strand:- start:201 stop:434 length:234 start_codon:yes stop_codon:yes gene_type:complete
MGFTSIWHWIIVLVVVLVLFGGRGKISSLMGDFGKGLKNFKKGVSSEDDERKTSSDVEAIENNESVKEDVKRENREI